jgi:hypothetical protein
MTHNIKAKPSLKKLPQTEKLPLKVGVYYSTEFSTYEQLRVNGPHKFVFPIGAASVDLFNNVLPQVFQDVSRVYSLPPFTQREYNFLDVVIEPQIEHFHFHLGMESHTDMHCIIYQFVLYTLDGAPVSTWKITGKGDFSQWDAPVWAHVNRDLDDAAKKFMVTFKESSGIDKIFVENTNQMLSGDMPCSLSQDDITIDASSYPITFRMKNNKTVSFTDVGIIPIKVSITNNGTAPVFLNVPSVRLYLNNEMSIPPAAVSSIFQNFDIRGYGSDAAAAFLGPLVGVAVMMAEESDDNKKRRLLQNQLKEIALRSTTLKKGQSIEGVISFIPAEDTPSFSDAEVSVWLLDKNLKGVNLRKPITNIRYKDTKEKK